MSHSIRNIVIIGTGNVAIHMARMLKGAGFSIAQVYGRNMREAKRLSDEVNSNFTNNPDNIIPDADMYIMAITESAITLILERISTRNRFIVHTAGSVSMDILKDYTENFGVLYPLQTFSKNDIIEYSDIPLCVEASSSGNLELLIELAKSISNDVRVINSDERKLIHLAAVFACNFPNLLYTIAEEILHKEGIGFDILLPLIKKTTEKIYASNPEDVQTGPAQRKDIEIIRTHLAMLDYNPEYKEIYKLLSEAIINRKY
jgi:predicted short-subunit dehydrogenase-like oxidoreductase (DUF2520 family)